MKGDTKVIIIIAALMLLGICSAMYSGVMPEKTTGEIEMLQPCGWPWCAEWDAHYAERVNEPNSRANLNNGQAELYNAQAAYAQAKADEKYIPVHIAGIVVSTALFGAIMLLITGGLIWLAAGRGGR